jgi:hypothetical protein
MNFKRRSHLDDVLFVITMLVPAVFAGARYVETDRQITQIAQAQSHPASVAANTRAPSEMVFAKTDSAVSDALKQAGLF